MPDFEPYVTWSYTSGTSSVTATNVTITPVATPARITPNTVQAWFEAVDSAIEESNMPNYRPSDTLRWQRHHAADNPPFPDLRLWATLDLRYWHESDWIEYQGEMHPREEAATLARQEAERRRQQHEEHMRIVEERRRVQIQERRRLMEEEERARAAREARAKELLEKFLNDDQIAMLNDNSYFEVEAEDGHVFRIREGKVGNIRCIDGPRWANREFCIHDNAYLPNLDCMLLQKVMIESDYDRFLRIANF